MSKILVIPNNIEEIIKTNKISDGYIIGINEMCVNANITIDLSELKELVNLLNGKDLFISINKCMNNSDLKKIRMILLELNKYNIKGVIYYDVAVLRIYNSLDLNYDLVWSNEHMVTNYNTINYWNKFNANYAYISSDITGEEIEEIIKNSKSKLLVNLFGYLPMFVSKRHIVKNYLEYFKLKDNSTINYIEKEDKVYPIIDNEVGTYVYSANILNGIKMCLNFDVEYIVLNFFNIEFKKSLKVLNIFKKLNKDNIEQSIMEINSLFSNIDSGFLDKGTIYKVKNNE